MEAAVEAKEALNVVIKESLKEGGTEKVTLSDTKVKNISKARANIILGLGDRQLRLFLSVKPKNYKT